MFCLFAVLQATATDVTLQNGKLLKNFEILNYGANVVTAKWEGGKGTVPYTQLPDGIRQKALENQKQDERAPSESKLSIASQRAAQERRMVAAKNRMEAYEHAAAQNTKRPMLKSEYDQACVEYQDARMKFEALSRKMN